MIFGRKDKTQTPPPEPVPAPAREGDRPGETWVSRLGMGLGKSSARLGQGLTDLVTKKKLDQETLDRLEEVLITADLGPKTAARVVADFAEGRFGKDIDDHEIREALAATIAKILEPVAVPLVPLMKPLPEGEGVEGKAGPFVILVCGVNGAGKTTTIGKLAHRWINTD
ncbi:MAG TPA: signal recognition particle receptor subunit alpha, partial [Micavibrio sp.]